MNARVLGYLAVLCIATSGYSSGCGVGDGPSPPRIQVEVSNVEWTVEHGDSTPFSRSIGVIQAGGGLAASIHYEGEPAVEWLTAEIAQQGNSPVILVTARAEGLEVGNYGASVNVSADEYSPTTIHVVLTVTP